MNEVFFGLDLSLNHFGMVLLDDYGTVLDYYAMVDTKKFLISEKHFFLSELSTLKEEDKVNFPNHRLGYVVAKILSWIENTRKNGCISSDRVFVAYEGYSYGSRSTALCQMAEVVGAVKFHCYRKGYAIRGIDPLTVKMFATDRGRCLKKDVLDAARVKGFDIPDESFRKVKVKGKVDVCEFNGPGTDLADAFFLSEILRTEFLLKEGIITLEGFSKNTKRVFTRVSKAKPVNLIESPFIRMIE